MNNITPIFFIRLGKEAAGFFSLIEVANTRLRTRRTRVDYRTAIVRGDDSRVSGRFNQKTRSTRTRDRNTFDVRQANEMEEGQASRSEETSRRNSRDHYRSLGVQVAGRDTSIECVSLYLAADYRERQQEMLVEISHGRPCN